MARNTEPTRLSLRDDRDAVEQIAATYLRGAGRLLLFGEPGSGKSTLCRALVDAAGASGRPCWALGADPGSPSFGLPGAVSLARRDNDAWHVEATEALCTLDAARYRLPLVVAVQRLVETLSVRTPSVPLLVDAPGVARGMAGAELLHGLIAACRADAVVVLSARREPVALAHELAALPIQLCIVESAAAAVSPTRSVRTAARTRLWDAYLERADRVVVPLSRVPLLGAPPPFDVKEAWPGRQVGLLDEAGSTLALGEVLAAEVGALTIRTPRPEAVAGVRALLVRDAQRNDRGLLATARAQVEAETRGPTLTPERAVDLLPRAKMLHAAERPVSIDAGIAKAVLVNGCLGDPLVHLRLREERRSMLLDLGDATRLQAHITHQVSDVLITHAHMDHIGGLMWLLRSRIRAPGVCRIFGPPGVARHVASLVDAIHWDRIGDDGPRFEVRELHGETLRAFRIQAGQGSEPLGELAALGGVLLDEPGFRVRAVTLDHGIPTLAFALEPSLQLNVRKEMLLARGLAPGSWLAQLKRALRLGALSEPVRLPNGSEQPASELADLVLVQPCRKVAYAADLDDSSSNRAALCDLARGAHVFFCEATFVDADIEQARRTKHLTARACGEIAMAAGVTHLVPFHFSRRYSDAPERVLRELLPVCPRTVVPRGII